jgi:GNAT superfamily N-acetyltransferase
MSDTSAGTLGAQALRPRKATAESLPTVSETLAVAFYDDPVVTWCASDGPRRRQILPRFFGAVAESYLGYDEIYDVDGGVSAAVWAPPAAEDDDQLVERVGGIFQEYADRVFEVLDLMDEKHPTDPHYYLFFLGTRPEWQGRGIGSALMAPVLETCDRERIPAYLEATSERNKALYLRNGFDVTGEIRIPDGPPLWPMWRTPH